MKLSIDYICGECNKSVFNAKFKRFCPKCGIDLCNNKECSNFGLCISCNFKLKKNEEEELKLLNNNFMEKNNSKLEKNSIILQRDEEDYKNLINQVNKYTLRNFEVSYIFFRREMAERVRKTLEHFAKTDGLKIEFASKNLSIVTPILHYYAESQKKQYLNDPFVITTIERAFNDEINIIKNQGYKMNSL
ncbi:MAG: hypothetical protein GY870_20260 [archaeon]|nr:hypothetical protein [archaeon]